MFGLRRKEEALCLRMSAVRKMRLVTRIMMFLKVSHLLMVWALAIVKESSRSM